MQKLAEGRLIDRLRAWFPDREFFMRSQGQVRFIKLSSRLQMRVAGLVAVLALVWVLSIGGMAISQYLHSRDRLSLLDREAKVTSAESRLNAYGSDIDKVKDDLKRRQDFIEKTTQSVLGDLPKDAKAGGLIWAKRTESGWEGQGVKAIGTSALERIGGTVGDLLLAVVGRDEITSPALHAVRSAVVKRPGTPQLTEHAFCWVVDFPLLEQDEETGRWHAMHHPFTAPKPEDAQKLFDQQDLGSVRANGAIPTGPRRRRLYVGCNCRDAG